jgi:tetratricopeptide (TPR) repeat protein
VERTDGNPFFVEEIINSLIETGTLISGDAGVLVAGSLTEADLPTSVRGVIAARIDRLDTDRRQVLREASVVGRQFLYEVIKRVATVTATLDPSLADLEHADLIRERSDPDLEYFFKHALTQDVAYEGLLKKERVELHARAARAIEEQFADRLGEVTETLAYHYTEAGLVDEAVHYLRAAGAKAMDRYALVEAKAHFERAYEVLGGAEAGSDHETALVDLILDWAILFYYQARMYDLGELLDRHQHVVERLGDEPRRMWWLIWRGHVAGFEIDQTDTMAPLEEALAIAKRIGDETGYAYARTWQVWGHFIAGRPNAAIEAAESIAGWVEANRDVDPYPFFKSRCTGVFAMTYAGRFDGIEDICADVVDFGHRVGNNRCVAYGIQALAMFHVGLGNYERAGLLAQQAFEIAKDPIYRDTSQLTVLAAASLTGDIDRVRDAVTYLRGVLDTGVQLPAPLIIEHGEAMLMMGDGDLSGGMARLDRAIALEVESSRIWEWLWGRAMKAIVQARIATGEIKGDLIALLRHPGAIAHVRKAGRQAEMELSAIRDDAQALGYEVFASVCDVEQAKLYISKGRLEEARPLLERALVFSDRSSVTEGADRIRGLLASV